MRRHRAFIGGFAASLTQSPLATQRPMAPRYLHIRPLSVAFRAAVDIDMLLRPWADSDEPELVFPSGQACPVSCVAGTNADFTSAMQDGYAGRAAHTADGATIFGLEESFESPAGVAEHWRKA